MASKTNYFELLICITTPDDSRRIPKRVWEKLLFEISISRQPHVSRIPGKTRAGNPDDPSNKFLKILNMGSSLRENMTNQTGLLGFLEGLHLLLGWFASSAWVVCIFRSVVPLPLNIPTPTPAPDHHPGHASELGGHELSGCSVANFLKTNVFFVMRVYRPRFFNDSGI